MSITLTRKTLFLIHRLHWYCTIMDATANCGCCKYVVCALMFFCILYSKNYPIFSNSHIAGSRQRSENNSSRNFSLMIPSVHVLHLQIHHTTHVYFVTYCCHLLSVLRVHFILHQKKTKVEINYVLLFDSGYCFLPSCVQLTLQQPSGRMSYGSIDSGSFGSRNPFGGPMRQGYQPVGKNRKMQFYDAI